MLRMARLADGNNNAPALDPQASSLLIPPFQKLASMPIGAPVENADNAQEEDASPQMPSQRRITKAIMREWGPIARPARMERRPPRATRTFW